MLDASEVPPETRQPISASSTLQLSTLRQLIRSVFDVLALFRSYLKPADRQYEPLFENMLQQELYALLLRWLKQVPSEVPLQEEVGETTALVISWAILDPQRNGVGEIERSQQKR